MFPNVKQIMDCDQKLVIVHLKKINIWWQKKKNLTFAAVNMIKYNKQIN